MITVDRITRAIYTIIMMMMMNETTKSTGHIVFDGDFEYFERGGEVYRAKLGGGDAMDTDGRRMCARWECSRAHFDHFRDVIISKGV